MFETKGRSIAKSVVWRLAATINGFLVAFIFLHELSQSVKIAVVANVTGFILYYLHERFWNYVNWGKK